METMNDFDSIKVRRSLDMAWQRNNSGKGMISFIMNWFAATEALWGNGEKAYELTKLCTSLHDSSETALFEVVTYSGTHAKGINPYFLTGYSSLIVSQVLMFLQSHTDQIRFFPACPDHWQDLEFYDLPVEGGISASAFMKSGKIEYISLKKGNRSFYSKFNNVPRSIDKTNAKTIMKIIN
jgi:hypothetical protein